MTVAERLLTAGFTLAIFTPVVLCGCGGDSRPGLVPVSGTVTLDGQPLPGATVAFQPTGEREGGFKRPSRGVTDAAGKFEVGTYAQADGMPEGSYQVAIAKQEPVGGKLPENYNAEDPDATPVKFVWITPQGYTDPATSGLTATVTSAGLEPSSFALTTTGAPAAPTPTPAGNEP